GQAKGEHGKKRINPYSRIAPPFCFFLLFVVIILAGIIPVQGLSEYPDEQRCDNSPEWGGVTVAAPLLFRGWIIGVYSITLLLPAALDLASPDRRSEDICAQVAFRVSSTFTISDI